MSDNGGRCPLAHRHRLPRTRATKAPTLPRQASTLSVSAVMLTMALWLWPVPYVIFAWKLLRKLPPIPPPDPEPTWEKRPLWFSLEPLDTLSLAILAVLWLLIWLGRNTIFPVPPDSYYHLLVARQVYETGSVPLWNSWEWAPVGRPHLYPPLYHILLALCAIPFRGDLLAAFRNVQPAILPFAYFTTWYLARWLFDARRAFAALLIVGMDAVLVFSAMMGTPGVLATSFISLMLVLFLSGRWIAATAMLTLAMYTHMGIPSLAVLGLGLFCLLHRAYLPRYAGMVLIAGLAALPWYARVYVFHDWFTHPMDTGIYGFYGPWVKIFMKITWLQMVNLLIVMMAVAAVGKTAWRERRNRLLLCFLLSFLPMLISYGGRYYIHTIHLWAIVAAGLFAGLLAEPLRWRRVGAMALIALCPAPAITGTGTPVAAAAYPAPSAWMLSPAVAMGALRYLDGGKRLGFVSFDNCQEVAKRVDAETTPDQILYFTWDRDLALPVAFLANRRIDVGAWEETMPGEDARLLNRWYAFHDPHACYISQQRFGIPQDVPSEPCGDLIIGFRKPASAESGTGNGERRPAARAK